MRNQRKGGGGGKVGGRESWGVGNIGLIQAFHGLTIVGSNLIVLLITPAARPLLLASFPHHSSPKPLYRVLQKNSFF